MSVVDTFGGAPRIHHMRDCHDGIEIRVIRWSPPTSDAQRDRHSYERPSARSMVLPADGPCPRPRGLYPPRLRGRPQGISAPGSLSASARGSRPPQPRGPYPPRPGVSIRLGPRVGPVGISAVHGGSRRAGPPSRRVPVRRALRERLSIRSTPETSRSPLPGSNPAMGTPRAMVSASSRMHPAPMVPSSAPNITNPPRVRTNRGHDRSHSASLA